VILVSVDTLRSDHLPAYGYRGLQTPAVDGLRVDSILFRNAYSHVPLTLPSHGTVFTGQLPPRNRVRDNYGFPLPPDLPTLADFLHDHGYATGAAVSASVLEKSAGIARGFDFYDDAIGPSGAEERDGALSAASLIRWMDTHRGGPFFAFLHLYEPHFPYNPPEPYRSRYPNPYDGEIARADEIVGTLLSQLKAWGVYDRCLIVFFSDHGEGLGDHGEQEHGVFLYREALQVPLLVKFPGQRHAGETVDGVAGLTDVFPTVAGALGWKPPSDLSGRDWSRGIRDRAPDRRIYAETFYPRLRLGWSELLSLIDVRYQYIEAPRPELYDIRNDPAERENLASTLPPAFRTMRSELAQLPHPIPSGEVADPERAHRLAALGYLSGAASAAGRGELPDPKDRIATLELSASLGPLVAAKREDDLVRVAREFLRENPAALEVARLLADTLERRGDRAGAIAALEKALRASARTAAVGRREEALERLAYLLILAGRRAEAFQIADVSAFVDPETLNAIGVAQAEEGHLEEARKAFERADRLSPNDPRTLRNLGSALLRSGNLTSARARLEESVRLDPTSASAWTSLGNARAQAGDEPGASVCWQKAVELDPAQYESLYNLAISAGRRGDVVAARRALKRFLAEAPVRLYAKQLEQARRLLGALSG